MINFLLKKLFWAASLASLGASSFTPVLAMDDESDLARTWSLSRSAPKTQDKINDVVSSTAQRVYEQINKNWSYVPSGQNMKMSTESTLWTPLWIDGLSYDINGQKQQTRVPTINLKTSPINLMEALEDLIAKPAVLECTIALTAAKIYCLRELLGQDYFNAFAISLYMVFQNDPKWNIEQFFHELPMQFLTTIKGKAIPGSITYLTNIPLYPYFKLRGNAPGDNLFCTAPDQYLGFCEIFRTGPQPEDIIEARDLVEFSRKDDVEKDREQHEKICTTFETNPVLFMQMRRQAQDKLDFYQFFDRQKINDFFETGEIDI